MENTIRKSLLYKSDVEYADFCINHVEGCSHNCQFPCYARVMAKRFGRIKKDSEWLNIKLVANAIELLDKEIPKYRDKIKFVHLCFMTDPFMYRQSEVQKMTLKIIQRLNKSQIRSTVLTKGIYPKELIKKDKFGNDNEYGITLVSLDKIFKKKFEPNSAPYDKRIQSIKYLHDNGLRTWVSMEPYPTPNMVKQSLIQVLKKISFVDKIIFGKLNYNVRSSLFKEENISFYDDCANTVKKFCEAHKIDYHIKYGTQVQDDKETVSLFKTEMQTRLYNSCYQT